MFVHHSLLWTVIPHIFQFFNCFHGLCTCLNQTLTWRILLRSVTTVFLGGYDKWSYSKHYIYPTHSLLYKEFYFVITRTTNEYWGYDNCVHINCECKEWERRFWGLPTSYSTSKMLSGILDSYTNSVFLSFVASVHPKEQIIPHSESLRNHPVILYCFYLLYLQG